MSVSAPESAASASHGPNGPASITSAPKPGQVVEHTCKKYTTIKEGLAHILVPAQADAPSGINTKRGGGAESGQAPQSVFYNPIQQFNRDLSVLAIRAFGQDLCERRMNKLAAKQNKQSRRKEQTANKRRKANDGSAVTNTSGEQHETVVGVNQADVTDSVPVSDGVIDKDADTPQHKPSKPSITFKILDALSATGLRALRYAHEIEFATHITANDLLQTATDTIKLNVKHNKLESKIRAVTSDARAHMYNAAFGHGMHEYAKYDVVDLDPYGTAVPFLDAAIETINDNGLLCVTCTDAGVFASCGYLEKTYALYGGTSLKGPHSHEAGLRLILHSIATTAARYGKSIEPLLSLSIDFYARVFVRVRKSPEEVKLLAGKTALVHQCDAGCGAWSLQPLARNLIKPGKSGENHFKYSAAQSTGSEHCVHCGFKTHLAGPMWMGPLHNPFFISKILSGLDGMDSSVYVTKQRIEGMLTSALDELDVLPDIERYKVNVSSDDRRTEATNPTSASTNGASVTETQTPVAAPGGTSTHRIPSLPHSTLEAHPFFFTTSTLAKVLHCVAPPEAAIKGALRHMGYVATRSHTKPGCIKTQAPWSVIWHIMREWVRQRAPVKLENQKKGSPGWVILGLEHDAEGKVTQRRREESRPAEPIRVEANSMSPGEYTDDMSALTDVVPTGPVINGGQAQAGKGVEQQSVQSDKKQPLKADEPSRTGEEKTTFPKVVFDSVLGKDEHGNSGSLGGGKRRKLVRYQENPRANWGPMSRACASK